MKITYRYRGVLYILLASLFFSCMSVCVRLSGDLPTVQKVFFRNLIALFIATFAIFRTREKFHLTNRCNALPLLGRVFFGTLGMLANFYAVDHLALSDATMLGKLAPFFAVLASHFILKERMTALQTATMAGAFIGAMFIVRPAFQAINLFPNLIGLSSGLFAGIAYTMVRLLGQRGECNAFIVFAFSAFSCLAALPFLIFDYRSMTTQQVLCLLGAGIFAAAGQFSITAAYTSAPAREISIFDYSEVLFSAILGFLIFGDCPDILSYIGYFIIMFMVILSLIFSVKVPNSESQIAKHHSEISE